jgi:hypothetical protein
LQVYTKDRKFGQQCILIPQKIYNITKRLKTSEELEKYFPRFIAFIDSTEQQISRFVDNKKRRYPIQARRKDIL